MAVSVGNLCVLTVVLLTIIKLGIVSKELTTITRCISFNESELKQERITILSKADRWKEVNVTTSSLTERSFLYHSNNTVNEHDAVSVWNFERLQMVVMANNSNSIAPTKSSSHWTETDVERWCPQPVLSVLESPKLVKAKDYQNGTIYPESYASKNHSAVALFTIPSVKNNSCTLTIVDSEKVVKAAVCLFLLDGHRMPTHFAHIMQGIYPCIDYWIANKGGDDDDASADPIIPVLLYNNTSQEEIMERWKTNNFMRGILGTLQEEMGGVIMTSEDYMTCAIFDINENDHSIPEIAKQMEVCKKVFHPEQTIRTSRRIVPGFTTFEKATEFNVHVESFLRKQNHTYEQEHLYHPGQWKKDADSSRMCARPPKIGILNRESSRGIINADQLAEDLSGLRYVYRKTNNDNDDATKTSIEGYPVEVIFFEGLSFAEQVEFFWRTDIVVSGHGAQLTGLPFLKVDNSVGRCRQVLELYSYEYIIPYYFGSLVVGTGMSHSYVYYDDGLRPERSEDPGTGKPLDRPPLRVRPLLTVVPWKRINAAQKQDRDMNRRSKFCPRRDDMVDYLSELIFDWYRCHGC